MRQILSDVFGLVYYCMRYSPGAKWHILAEPGNVSVSFFLDGFG